MLYLLLPTLRVSLPSLLTFKKLDKLTVWEKFLFLHTELGINAETIFFSKNIMNIEANIWQQDR